MVVERLEDQGASHYSYTFVESPLPLNNYHSTIRVSPKGSGCVVDWQGSFEPAGISEEEAIALIGGVYDAGLAAL